MTASSWLPQKHNRIYFLMKLQLGLRHHMCVSHGFLASSWSFHAFHGHPCCLDCLAECRVGVWEGKSRQCSVRGLWVKVMLPPPACARPRRITKSRPNVKQSLNVFLNVFKCYKKTAFTDVYSKCAQFFLDFPCCTCHTGWPAGLQRRHSRSPQGQSK